MATASKEFRRFRVIPIEDGQPLSLLLSRRLPGVDRNEAGKIIKAGGVYVNKLRVRLPMVRVAAGERITVYPHAHEATQVDPTALVFVHRDPDFVVLDKPVGVPVAQTRESAQGTLAAALRRYLEAQGARRPYVGVVHRLDRGASGLVLFTIRDVANKSIHKQFLEHTIERDYLLEVHGTLAASFTADGPLRLGKRTVSVAEAGDPLAAPARTHFELLASYDAAAGESPAGPRSLLRARLETGRTHQIRAHIAHAGYPVVGDRRYGQQPDTRGTASADTSATEDLGLRLHAAQLRLAHPKTGVALDLTAARPTWARLVASTS